MMFSPWGSTWWSCGPRETWPSRISYTTFTSPVADGWLIKHLGLWPTGGSLINHLVVDVVRSSGILHNLLWTWILLSRTHMWTMNLEPGGKRLTWIMLTPFQTRPGTTPNRLPRTTACTSSVISTTRSPSKSRWSPPTGTKLHVIHSHNIYECFNPKLGVARGLATTRECQRRRERVATHDTSRRPQWYLIAASKQVWVVSQFIRLV